MGAWDTGPLQNDDAADWVAEWDGVEDLSPVRDALLDVILADDYLEAPEGARGIAAAQVVAVLTRRAPLETLPEEIRAWVAAHPQAAEDVDEQAAVHALDRVLADNSELAELWWEAGNESWFDEVRRLRSTIVQE